MPNSAASAEPLDVAHGNVDSVWPIDDDAALRRFIAQKPPYAAYAKPFKSGEVPERCIRPGYDDSGRRDQGVHDADALAAPD